MRLREHHYMIFALACVLLLILVWPKIRSFSFGSASTSFQAYFPKAQVNNPNAAVLVTPGNAFTPINPLSASPNLM